MKFKKNTIAEILGMLIIASLGLLITSCSPSTSPKKKAPTDTTTTLSGRVGSTFTDSAYTRDTNLIVIPGTGTTIVYTLADTNFSIGGKTKVSEFTSAVDTIYLYYETNGDISSYMSFAFGNYSAGKEWVTFPSQSQGTIPVTPLTTFIYIDSVQVTGTAKGIGTGVYLLGTDSLSTGKTSLNLDAFSPKYNTHVTAAINSGFSSRIGFFTRYDVSTTGNFLGNNLKGGVHRFLISEHVK